jgi:hypothetical protein
LKLAFEVNGIYHYEPIHGMAKLGKVQQNDGRKFITCHESGIELCIIDASQLKYFKHKNALPYLEIFTAIINKRIRGDRFEQPLSQPIQSGVLPIKLTPEH